MKKRHLSLMLVLMLLMLCAFPTASLAADHEISADGTYSLSDYTFSAGDTLTIREGLTVTLSGSGTNISIVCEPNVNLTINGVGITVTGYELSPIAFTGGTANTLTIAGDSSLTAQNNQAALGVEGSTALTISGSGTLHATSFQGAAIGSGISADSGVITITGGNIDAQCGSNGAGIGGGGGRSNGTVNITGGTVYASSGLRGAGIGGGGDDISTGGSGGIINISGGDVTARGIRGGAGIGGGISDTGNGGAGGIIHITGGEVNATSEEGGAGIGGGRGGAVGGAGGTVTITNEASVSATGSVSGYDVGGGGGATSGTGGTLLVDGYAILRLRANGTNAAATVNTGTVTGNSGGLLSGAYYDGTKLPGEVIDWGDPYLASGTGYTFNGSEAVIRMSGDYVVVGKKTLNYSTITVNPGLIVNIALLNTYMYRDNGFSPLNMQGATVTATLYGDTEMICNDRPAIWLNPSSDLTIQGSGKLTATAGGTAGIGSTVNVDNGRITIKGGTIIATGGIYSAGIGGDGDGDGGIIRIEGGNVTATGGSYSGTQGGAGIGGGTYASGGAITITGGTVTAIGGLGSAGIGGGGTTNTVVGNGGTINISGGTVNATGGSNGAGIGGGKGGSGGVIHISGSAEVIATGGASAAGIGGGSAGTAGTITLSGGIVYAAGKNGGQDIGYGESGSGGTLHISDSAAAFLGKDSSLTPLTTTHTHLTYTEDADEIYGYDIPSAWVPVFGAFLRIHTLSYDGNGGIGTVPSPETKRYQDTTGVLGGSALTYENYTFSGWNTAADGSGTDYNEGDTFTFISDTTLFAQWVRNTNTGDTAGRKPDLPRVVTNSVTQTSVTGVKLSGSVVSGGAAVTECGFVYGTTPNPVIGGAGVTKVAAGDGRGDFTATLTGLFPETIYYVRTYAISGAGTAYGAVISFATNAYDLADIPKTGDDSSSLVWWLPCGVSAAGIAALIILDKKRRSPIR